MSEQLKSVYPKQFIYFYYPSRIVYFYRKLFSRELRKAHINEGDLFIDDICDGRVCAHYLLKGSNEPNNISE